VVVTIVRNGAVVTLGAAGTGAPGVLLEGARMAETGWIALCAGDHQVDASGCWALPGFVQAHVHPRQTIWPMELGLDTNTAAASARWGEGHEHDALSGRRQIL
jgi:predicted amidohydrolase YtcJ